MPGRHRARRLLLDSPTGGIRPGSLLQHVTHSRSRNRRRLYWCCILANKTPAACITLRDANPTWTQTHVNVVNFFCGNACVLPALGKDAAQRHADRLEQRGCVRECSSRPEPTSRSRSESSQWRSRTRLAHRCAASGRTADPIPPGHVTLRSGPTAGPGALPTHPLGAYLTSASTSVQAWLSRRREQVVICWGKTGRRHPP
jgi:hypothetical protein